MSQLGTEMVVATAAQVSPNVAEENVADLKPLMALPPPASFEWVVKKTLELSCRMGVSFEGIGYKVEELFREIERRWLRLSRSRTRNLEGKKGTCILKNLSSSINYDGLVDFKRK